MTSVKSSLDFIPRNVTVDWEAGHCFIVRHSHVDGRQTLSALHLLEESERDQEMQPTSETKSKKILKLRKLQRGKCYPKSIEKQY
jgi:hypothetical protein